MSLINIVGLTFAYDGSYDNIFEDVSFQLDTDWKLGFTGRNGRGKTTFMNLLLGKYSYQGIISASVDFEYFPYEVQDKSVNTIDIAYEKCPDLEYWEIAKELSLLDVDDEVLYRPFETLSNGEQTKVLLCILFLKANAFLLIDEPTNHLDMQAREVVAKYLNRKKGFILVSHDRAVLDNCIDHILSINLTGIEIQKGNFSSWQENKKRQDNFELAENERLKADIKHLSQAAKRTSDWSDKVESTKNGSKNSGLRPDRGYIGHKSAKMMARSKAIEERREKAVADKSALLKNIENADNLKISPLKYHSSQLLYLDNVAVSYDGKMVCENVSFSVNQGDRVLLSGKNGCGKSSILKLICGEDITHSGNIQTGSSIKISYLPQNADFLCGSLSDFAYDSNIDESLFKAILRKLDFSRLQFEKDMENFSSGQKKKVLIAKSLCEQAHIYVWDEALNFIDIMSRIQIEELLTEYEPTMIFVEHDKTFADKIANKVVEIIRV